MDRKAILLFSLVNFLLVSTGIIPLAAEENLPKCPFQVGEELTFEIEFLGLAVGWAGAGVKEITNLKGKEVYRIVYRLCSTPFFSIFYRVDDHIESYIDVQGFFSRGFEKLQKGRHQRYQKVIYDQENRLAITDGRKLEIPYGVQDIVSAFYYVRTKDLKLGENLFVETNTGEKNYRLEVKVLKREKVKTPVGTFQTLVLETVQGSGGIFKKEGSLRLWLTDDRVRMPVLMKSKVAVGSILATLIDFKGVEGYQRPVKGEEPTDEKISAD